MSSFPKKRYSPFYIRPSAAAASKTVPTLAQACRSVVVTNLEKYPPESFSIVDTEEWEIMVQLRYERTQPRRISTNALHGGRLVAPVSAKYLVPIETENTHLAESNVSDVLLWKYCVEFKFRRGGLSRPVEMELPWPMFVAEMKQHAESLANAELRSKAIQYLVNIPVSVALLRDTGAGKTVKKAIKKLPDLDKPSLVQLKELLARWMTMVDKPEQFEPNENLAIAATCSSWRQLYYALNEKDGQIRLSQGKKMRDVRRNLARTRPKMVKVRPASSSAKRNTASAIKISQFDPNQGSSSSKLFQMRKQAAGKKKTSNPSSFSDAVAFNTASSKNKVHVLGKGKRMTMPNGPPRQFMKRPRK